MSNVKVKAIRRRGDSMRTVVTGQMTYTKLFYTWSINTFKTKLTHVNNIMFSPIVVL